MLRLLQFLFRRRILGLFLVLEAISLWLLFSFNNRYNTYYLNSSNQLVGSVSEQINSIKYYFSLQEVNQELSEENKNLRRLLANQILDTSSDPTVEDSADFTLYLTKVVNSGYRNSRNYITLRKRPTDSIKPGMGVMSSAGVVGRVKSVSNHFATVISLLNPNLMISGRVASNGALSTVQWEGEDPLEATLKYVPRHLNLQVGDSVLTSGFDGMFPEKILIGIVAKVDLKRESAFYDARVRLANDFTNFHRAYVVKIHHNEEKLNLEKEVLDE